MAAKLILQADPLALTRILKAVTNSLSLTLPIDESKKDYRVKGTLNIEAPNARVSLVDGLLTIGPVEVTIDLPIFRVFVDWHDGIGIPRRACLISFDACGQRFEICWTWDFGVTTLNFDKTHIEFKESIRIDSIVMKDAWDKNGKKFYALYGNVPVASYVQDLPGVLLQAVTKGIADTVSRFLDKVLGGTDLAQLFKDLILGTWQIVSTVVWLLNEIGGAIFRLLEIALEKAIGKKLVEIELGFSIPATPELMAAEGRHAAVLLPISKTPLARLDSSGLVLEIEP